MCSFSFNTVFKIFSCCYVYILLLLCNCCIVFHYMPSSCFPFISINSSAGTLRQLCFYQQRGWYRALSENFFRIYSQEWCSWVIG